MQQVAQQINSAYSRIQSYLSLANITALAIIAVWVALIILMWTSMVPVDAKGIHAGSANLWADWVLHMTYTNIYYDWPVNYWLDHNPIFAEGNFRYPPLPNLISALFVMVGLSFTTAMVLSSLLLFIAMLAMLLVFFRAFDVSLVWAAVGVTLFLLNGGVGFWYYLFDNTESATHLDKFGIVIQNFIISEFIPQRAILFAAPFFLGCVILLKQALQTETGNFAIGKMVAIALLTNILMLSSMHTYLSFVMLCFFIGLQTLKHWKAWAVLIVCAGITNAVCYFGYYGVNETEKFLQYNPGELIKFSKLCFLNHFLKNYGIVLPLVILAIYRIRAWRDPFIVAGCLLFFIVYLVQFQPWIWDNSKILTWAYLILLVPVIQWLGRIWHDKIVLRGVVTCSILFAVASGAIDVWNVTKPDRKTYQMFSTEEIEIAKAFKQLTRLEDVVLTHTGHNNWVHTLASRQVFMGFTGWLWSYGLDIPNMEQQKNKMLSGDWDTLKAHNIKYIVIDRYHEPGKVNTQFTSSLKVLIQSNRYGIYATGL